MLGDGRGRDPDRLLELAHAHRGLTEQLEDADSEGMGERLEELRLELAEPVGIVGADVAGHRPGQNSPSPPSAQYPVSFNTRYFNTRYRATICTRRYSTQVTSARLTALQGFTTSATSHSGPPWAFAVNETATCDDIEVTLLAFVVVDELIRISGLARIGRRIDVGLAGVPDLAVSSPAGMPLPLRSAHLLPKGDEAAWVSWLFERPAQILGTYGARIERIDLGRRMRIGATPVRHQVAGPWLFAFALPTPGRRAIRHRAEARQDTTRHRRADPRLRVVGQGSEL